MLEIVRIGQPEKESFLHDFFRLRKRVFFDRLNWDVKIQNNEFEIDCFDIKTATYLIALNNCHVVVGGCRLLPTSGPNMIYDVWPELLSTIRVPRADNVWESSRFSVDSNLDSPKERTREATLATAELTCGLVELCLLSSVKEFYTFYDDRIARLMRLAGCEPDKLSQKIKVDRYYAQVGSFNITPSLISKLRQNMGIHGPLLQEDKLVPCLSDDVDLTSHFIDLPNIELLKDPHTTTHI